MARKAEYDIAPMILNRWSARAMSGEPLAEKELMPLFEAARWAPSSFNGQPWRFLYARRDTKHWEVFFNLLGDWNRQWCKNAAALIVIISRKNFEHNGKPSRTHEFDTGAAWENFALEGTRRGLVVHGMEGFSYDRARKELSIPDDYDIECMVAVGKHGRKEDLPPEMQKSEVMSDRRPARESVIEGPFKAKPGAA